MLISKASSSILLLDGTNASNSLFPSCFHHFPMAKTTYNQLKYHPVNQHMLKSGKMYPIDSIDGHVPFILHSYARPYLEESRDLSDENDAGLPTDQNFAAPCVSPAPAVAPAHICLGSPMESWQPLVMTSIATENHHL